MVELFVLDVAKHRDLIKSEKARNAVSPERLEKSKKYRNEPDFLLSMGGELLARAAAMSELAKLGGISVKNSDISFGRDPKGKSYIKNFEYLHFNVSHSGEIAICALSMKEVGADCEVISPDNGIEEAKNVFCPEELDSLKPLAERARFEKLHEIWVLKESYVKYRGDGVTGAMENIRIAESGGVITATVSGRPAGCVFKLYDIGPEYRAAVCADEKHFVDSAKFVNPTFIERIF